MGEEVVAVMGARRRATAPGGGISIETDQPTLQIGQRRGSGSPVSMLGSAAVGRAGSKERHSASFFARLRLAKKPKCRIRTKPEGNTWRRKRRMNSTASSVIVLLWFPWA